MDKILETERLYLRRLQLSDEDVIARMYLDFEVMRYIGRGVIIPKKYVIKSIEIWIEYESKFGFSNWAIVNKENDELIGKCGYNWLSDNSDIEISYILDKPYWGKGLATEIARAALDHGFKNLGFKRVVGLVYPQNTQSAKVLKKIGMAYEKDVYFWDILFNLFSVSKPETFK
jgi:ribosomal-protein-alanine N-acetyltransferase